MNKTNNVVRVFLSGGLGNQLFQYAAGRALSLRLGLPLYLDVSWFKTQSSRIITIDNFKISGHFTSDHRIFPRLLRPYVARISQTLYQLIYKSSVLCENQFVYNEKIETVNYPIDLHGYWQSYKYFNSIRNQLLEDLVLKSNLPLKCIPIYNEIISSGKNSICVHVRRGDYVTNKKANEFHGTCSIEFYDDSIKKISIGLKSPKCFVFSDDPKWARNFLNVHCDIIFVDINNIDEVFLDLYLMSKCSKFVIANSTLSWWAAWLGECSDKKIIAPLRWLRDTSINVNDLFPTAWDRL